MHNQTELVPLEIDAVITQSEPMQYPAIPLQSTEPIRSRTHQLVWHSAEFA